MSPQAFLKLPQVVRFLLLGGLAAAINWLVRFPLSLVLPFPAAVFVAYLIGMSAGFTLYRAYALGAVVVMAVSLALLDHLLPAVGWRLLPEAVAHGTAIGVGAVANFFGHKYLSFRTAPDHAENLT